MSNHLAIATVTATLRLRLEQELQARMSGASATTVRPLSPPSPQLPSPGVNIYLFQVATNPALANEALPSRRTDGQLLQRPVIALNLHYLLSFYGNEAKQESQVAMGIAARTLQAQPVLSRELIEQAIAGAPYLKDSDLASSIERIRLLPTMTSMDDMSKLWTMFQTPYVLSTTYQASVVLIEGEAAPRAPALPVRGITSRATVFQHPVIDSVLSQAPGDPEPSAGQPILVGHRLILRGHGLQAGTQTPELDTLVRIGCVELPPESTSSTEVTIALPNTLAAGVQRVQVVHRERIGSTPRRGAESSVAAFVLQPEATFSKGAGKIEATVSPQVQKGQNVILFLNQYNAPNGAEPKAFSVPLTVTAASSTLAFPLGTVASGDYLLRVQVDGAESPLAFNEVAGRYDQPRLTLP